MRCSTTYRLVHIHVAVADFDIEPARRVGTHPGFISDWSPLAAEIGKGYEVANFTMLALWKRYFHHGILPHFCHHNAEYLRRSAPPLYACDCQRATQAGRMDYPGSLWHALGDP
jgi:hypothetical protein